VLVTTENFWLRKDAMPEFHDPDFDALIEGRAVLQPIMEVAA
jgi:hypothetical protein